MRKSLAAIFIFLASTGFAQDFQKEINSQVWIPFMHTFGARDTEGFMALHSKDVIRSPRDGNSILNFDQYKKQIEQGNKNTNSTPSLELHFIERLATKDQAFEIGVYKTTYINAQGDQRSFYGKFHVALRKESGVWKILVDTDSSEGGTIGEKNFLEAKPLQ